MSKDTLILINLIFAFFVVCLISFYILIIQNIIEILFKFYA